MKEQSITIVDATIRKYLADKVRERFQDDVHLIEPILDNLVARYSMKELFITCSVEISRLKNQERAQHTKPGRV